MFQIIHILLQFLKLYCNWIEVCTYFLSWKNGYSFLTDPIVYYTKFFHSTTNTLLLLGGRQQLIFTHLLILFLEPSTKLAHGRGSTVYSFSQFIHFLSCSYSITKFLCDVEQIISLGNASVSSMEKEGLESLKFYNFMKTRKQNEKRHSIQQLYPQGTHRYVGKTVLVLSFPDLIFFLLILSPSGQRVTVLVRAEIKPPSLLDLCETNRPPIHVESQIFLGFNMVRERCWTSPFNFLMN